MMPASRPISLFHDADADVFHQAFQEAWWNGEPVEIWAVSVVMLRPYAVVGLAAAIHWCEQNGRGVTFRGPASPNVFDHLGLYDVLPATVNVQRQAGTALPYASGPDIILPIRMVRNDAEVNATVEEFIESSREKDGWIRGIAVPVAQECLSEALDNAMEHSGSGACFVSACSASERGPLSLSIVDLGVGIPNHLRQREKYAEYSDELALNSAVEERVSGIEDNDRGFGLNYLRERARKSGAGIVAIRAGEAELRLKFESGKESRENTSISKLPGTWIRIEIRQEGY
jgi:hypothetical protein